MAEEEDQGEQDTEPKTVEIQYFEAGSRFFDQNRGLLGLTLIDMGQDLGELTPRVREALDTLAIATAERMADIMRMGPKFFERERASGDE